MRLPEDFPSLVTQLIADAAGRRAVIVIDGGSGAGKTGLACALANTLEERGIPGIQLVSMDSFYPDWQGLAAASAMLPEVLRTTNPGYWRWDWQTHRRLDRVPLNGAASMVLEGCGALTPESQQLASTSIWLACAPATRKQRALSRDGEAFAPHWEQWARQERQHWRTNRPRSLADIVVTAAR